MTLTPEQKAEGWIEWNGGECPINDRRTTIEYRMRAGDYSPRPETTVCLEWRHFDVEHDIIAYRIIEAHGADAEPARPTPFLASYDELVFDDDGWSQTIIVDGKRPEWLRDDDLCVGKIGSGGWSPTMFERELAIRVRRREPKRETQRACLRYQTDRPFDTDLYVTIDLIDGKPDLSTLKIEEKAL